MLVSFASWSAHVCCSTRSGLMRFAGSANLPIINCVTAYRNPKREVSYLKCWTNVKKKKRLHKMCSLMHKRTPYAGIGE